jgi:hypothetical protein
MWLIDEKTESQKSRDTLPLKYVDAVPARTAIYDNILEPFRTYSK